MADKAYDADIIVAGAGPSGLVTAIEALLGGAKVLVLEKRNGPTWARAGNLTPRVLELFASRGLVDRVMARAFELHSEPRTTTNIWAGLPGLDYSLLETDYPYVVFLSQIETERLLASYFTELGGDLRLLHEVQDFTQDEQGVSVQVDTPDGQQRFKAGYLIGADGNRSTVRKAAGIDFAGQPARRYAINVDAHISNPYTTVSFVGHSQAGWALSYPLRDEVTRLGLIDAATTEGPRDQPPSLEEAVDMVRRVHGSDFDIKSVESITHFHDAMFMAERMRQGRVFLVGEAVRIHYPASGVGMNFCIQDAFNLGWKLAAVATGRADDFLLDSYESERRPEILKLLDDVRRQCAIQFHFDAEHEALKTFIERDLISIPEVNLKLCGNLAGLSVRYDWGQDGPPLLGARMPNIAMSPGTPFSNLFESLRKQDFLLVDLTGRASLPVVPEGLRLCVVRADSFGHLPEALAGLSTVMVRPDGYVVYASDQSLDVHVPWEALARWVHVPDITSQARAGIVEAGHAG
jgi:2-polyprenyl-6-methoxyphenol hydroxylase-like FAD-dependent oxidoreductase